MGFQVTCAMCAEPHVQTDYCLNLEPVGDEEEMPVYHPAKMVYSNGPVRTFPSGATRDTDANKLDFEGFLSPLAIQEFAEYMHTNRVQSDGTLRSSDNWQKGIPLDAYMKSMWRHFFAVWDKYRAGQRQLPPQDDASDKQIENLCALLFNVQGMLHEMVKLRERG